jgi:hypothetical protein
MTIHHSLRRDIKAWTAEEVRAWARRVCGRPRWRLCGLAMAVIRIQNDNEVLTRLAENLALERDQLKQKLEGLT